MVLRAMCVAAAMVVSAAASAGPQVSIGSINDLTEVPDRPYDPAQDAAKAVDTALARAAQNHKRVLIDMGGNWCADCRILSAVMALPEVDAFLKSHYEVVLVDIGRVNRNLQIPSRFGITPKLEGVPDVLIVTPEGKLLNGGHTEVLAEARKMTPQAISDWLASWAE